MNCKWTCASPNTPLRSSSWRGQFVKMCRPLHCMQPSSEIQNLYAFSSGCQSKARAGYQLAPLKTERHCFLGGPSKVGAWPFLQEILLVCRSHRTQCERVFLLPTYRFACCSEVHFADSFFGAALGVTSPKRTNVGMATSNFSFATWSWFTPFSRPNYWNQLIDDQVNRVYTMYNGVPLFFPWSLAAIRGNCGPLSLRKFVKKENLYC